uniref:IQ motif containing E n=1 Tax=Canis lupus familiaris TaxID=9615 RepID=A0A8P0T1Y7_CANLF
MLLTIFMMHTECVQTRHFLLPWGCIRTPAPGIEEEESSRNARCRERAAWDPAHAPYASQRQPSTHLHPVGVTAAQACRRASAREGGGRPLGTVALHPRLRHRCARRPAPPRARRVGPRLSLRTRTVGRARRRRPHPGPRRRRGYHGSGGAAGARAGRPGGCGRPGGPRSRAAGQPRPQRPGPAGQRRRHVAGHRGAGLRDESPYHSKPRKVASWRSLRTAASMPLGNRMSLTPQKLWLGSTKQGSLTQPLKSDLTLEHAWTNPPSSTPDYLTEALRMKRSNLRRSASNGHVPGTLIYREKEDMYDEIIELKKSLHMQKSDVDLMRTKLRRLEEENSRKDRQIEQLLDSSRGPDFVRTLAEKRPDTGWVINGLKQRILKLEQQCKEKDNTINKLQTDMKTTNLEEMRIAMETYYEEIHRLQTLLASSETVGKKPPGEKKMGLRRQKKVSSALLSLSRSVQELTEENQSLKEDLDRVLSNSPTVSTMKGYMEWSKPRLLRRITELEKKISSMESPKLHASEVVKANAVVHSASSSTVSRQPRGDQHEDNEHLRGTVRSLKGERNALQMQLQEKDLEMKQLLQTNADLQKELEDMKGGEEERRGREEALREEIQTLVKKCQELEEIRRAERDNPVEMSPETPEEPRPSLPTSRLSQQDHEPDPSEEGFSWPPSTCSEGQRDTAARILQARWKRYCQQKKEAVLAEAATVLQSAFRGHLARVKLLSSQACTSESPGPPSPPGQQDPLPPRVPSRAIQAQDDPGEEEAITTIQSVLRAHLARVRHSAASQRATPAASRRRRPALAPARQPPAPPCPAFPGNFISSWISMQGAAGPLGSKNSVAAAPEVQGVQARAGACPRATTQAQSMAVSREVPPASALIPQAAGKGEPTGGSPGASCSSFQEPTGHTVGASWLMCLWFLFLALTGTVWFPSLRPAPFLFVSFEQSFACICFSASLRSKSCRNPWTWQDCYTPATRPSPCSAQWLTWGPGLGPAASCVR